MHPTTYRCPVGVGTLAAAMSLFVAVGVALPAQAANEARGDWRMLPQSKDVDGDGFIDGDGGVPAKRPLGALPCTIQRRR